MVPDRINAVNAALRDQAGVSIVEIDPSCEHLIDDLEQTLRDDRGGIKKSHDRRDPYYQRTHDSDAFGYWVSYEQPVRRVGPFDSLKAAIGMPGYSWAQR